MLFADRLSLAEFRGRLSEARSGGPSLRVRLVLDERAPTLNDLAWETLIVPGDDLPLTLDEHIAFCRFLGAKIAHNAARPQRTDLRGLAVVANPANVATYNRKHINADWMLESIRNEQIAIAWTELEGSGKAHLDAILGYLRDGHHILVFVGHGSLYEGEPSILLEDQIDGTAVWVSGCKFATEISAMNHKPVHAILASCETAGAPAGDPLQSLGPLLVKAGIPAVVAMRGEVSRSTDQRFLEVMSQELNRHGVIDRAVTRARWAVRGKTDWWAPVLFLALRDGRLWAEQVQASARRRVDFYRHIDRPPHNVPRPELIAEINQTMLADHTLGRPVALHGMGGISKSVTALALCDAPDVQAAYPDGILWTTLGQTPDLIPKLRDWVQELGGIVSDNAPTVANLKSSLAKLLVERRGLLVVDDVWRVEDVQVFLVPAPKCRVLMTTRDAAVVEAVGAAAQPVPLMAVTEAVALLRAWADTGLEGVEDDQAVQAVERLGRLPLALKLAGPQLKEVDPETWLQEFDARDLVARREEGPHSNLELTLGLSVDRLSEQDRHLYAALTIFPEDESIPLAAVAMLWRELGGLTSRQLRRLMRDLVDRALVQIATDGDYGNSKVKLHDLLHEFMALELSEAGTLGAHAALLEGYRQTQTAEEWHTAPDDGYLYGHLAYHLEKLAAADSAAEVELDRLFADDEWMLKRVVASGYQYDGFLADMDRMRAKAYREIAGQVTGGGAEKAIGQIVRCALIRSSINSLSEDFHPKLAQQAVRAGVWSVAHGLNVAAKVPDPGRRKDLFTAVLDSRECDGDQYQYALQARLDAVLDIQSEVFRAMALADLAPKLQGRMLRAGLDAALAILDERVRSRALAALAPNLADPTHLRYIRRQIASDLYTAFCQSTRADLLRYLATTGLIAPPLFTPEEVAAVAEAVLDVTTNWRWV